MNEKFCILIKISLKFVPKGPIGLDNGLSDDKKQTINWNDADPVHWRIYAALEGDELMGPAYSTSLTYIMVCHPFSTNLLPKSILTNCKIEH